MMRRQALQLLGRALHASGPRAPPLRRPQLAAVGGWRSGGAPAGFFSTDAAAGASAAAGAAQGGSKSQAAATASPGAVQGGSKPAAAAAVAQGSGGEGGGQDGKSDQDKGKSVRGGPVSWLSFLLLLVTGGGIIVYYDKEKKRQIEGRLLCILDDLVPWFLRGEEQNKFCEASTDKFHEDLIGLTGTSEEIRKVARAYRVYYMKTEEEGSDYLVDHSIVIYLMNPKMEFVKFFGNNYDEDTLAQGIIKEIREHKSS
ncbi:hypothetical protein ACQ4PT_021057 [Festuca glaucescens]